MQAQADTIIGSLPKTVAGTDAKNADPMQLGMKMCGKIQHGRTLAQKAIKDAQAVLTPQQWARIPKDVKESFQRLQNGGGEGRFGPPWG